jgi:hypothetical protein
VKRLANRLLVLGVAIGLVGAVGLAVGFRPSQLPAALLDISVYKLVFIAAGCVLAAGALILRAERRRAERERTSARPPELEPGSPLDARSTARHERERSRN